ncbi:MAG: hypothetical protein HY904_01705 [Deltaproteobacteria bacterium]|nr:hypothetical protein [Deltaproteobacteria bacterium]
MVRRLLTSGFALLVACGPPPPGPGAAHRAPVARVSGALCIDATDRLRNLLLTNLNLAPIRREPEFDSDADGLGDEREGELGTDAAKRDSDGDGCSDLVELRAGRDPLQAEQPACGAMDSDGDELRDDEEGLLGLDPAVLDTDGDDLPDGLEVVLGTDPARADADADMDGDGSRNRSEALAHQDATSAVNWGNGFRITLMDQGTMHRQQCFQFRFTGVWLLPGATNRLRVYLTFLRPAAEGPLARVACLNIPPATGPISVTVPADAWWAPSQAHLHCR